MTALYPSREDPELNARALAVLERDKRNEAACLMDGAWTGHPDQNAIAVAQFPAPQSAREAPVARDRRIPICARTGGRRHDDARRNARRGAHGDSLSQGVLEGRGASLLDGYMEDLATDRIYRLMIAQRLRYPGDVHAGVARRGTSTTSSLAYSPSCPPTRPTTQRAIAIGGRARSRRP